MFYGIWIFGCKVCGKTDPPYFTCQFLIFSCSKFSLLHALFFWSSVFCSISTLKFSSSFLFSKSWWAFSSYWGKQQLHQKHFTNERLTWTIQQIIIIIHQTHYEKSDWSRAFNQFTIACELDMINVISAADITSTSAWLLSPLECSPQKQNGWTLRFCFWGWIMWKMYNKTIIEFGFCMISWIIKTSCLCYLPQPSALADNTDLGFDNSWYHAQPHPIIVYCLEASEFFRCL